MRNFLKGILAGVMIAVILCVIVTTTNFGEQITVFFDAVKHIVVNNKELTIEDDMKPFIHNGRTYLSLRQIAEALGQEVGWHAVTGTAYVGEKPDVLKRIAIEDSLTNYEDVIASGNGRGGLTNAKAADTNTKYWACNDKGMFSLNDSGYYEDKQESFYSVYYPGTFFRMAYEEELGSLRYVMEADVMFASEYVERGETKQRKAGDVLTAGFYVDATSDLYFDYRKYSGRPFIGHHLMLNELGVSAVVADQEDLNNLDERGRPYIVLDKYYHLRMERDVTDFKIYLDEYHIKSRKYNYGITDTGEDLEQLYNSESFAKWYSRDCGLYTYNSDYVYFKNFTISLME